MTPTRSLILVLGDQLDSAAPPIVEADASQDVFVMAEVESEIRRHPNHKKRVVLFLSAMRHFRDQLRGEGFSVRYQAIDGDREVAPGLPEFLERQVNATKPDRVIVTEPGRYGLAQELEVAATRGGAPLDVRSDPHFLCTKKEFRTWADGRKSLVMEHFYRHMRKRYGVLLNDGKPIGDRWNFDKENRQSFTDDPKAVPPPARFPPDPVTRDVMALVEERFGDLPGNLTGFDWPVTP
ncbi:MAG: cryptochrome/photolyase family protein, partial [Gemmatimonadota bacterium]|nr:cryptochrome/photolyase family protein [Gemmatimonadota bacterium]